MGNAIAREERTNSDATIDEVSFTISIRNIYKFSRGYEFVVAECPEGAFRCDNGQCLPAYEFCNAVVSCRDGSDEPRDACRRQGREGRGRRTAMAATRCPFRCDNGRCRSDAIACSGRDGCGDASDERRCSVCSQYTE